MTYASMWWSPPAAAPRNVGPPLPGMPSVLEPQGAGMAAVCPMRYADDTQAITLALAEAPMAEGQAVTDRMAVRMAGTGHSGTQLSPPRGSCGRPQAGCAHVGRSRHMSSWECSQR